MPQFVRILLTRIGHLVEERLVEEVVHRVTDDRQKPMIAGSST